MYIHIYYKLVFIYITNFTNNICSTYKYLQQYNKYAIMYYLFLIIFIFYNVFYNSIFIIYFVILFNKFNIYITNISVHKFASTIIFYFLTNQLLS